MSERAEWVVELRRYTLRPGQRDTLIELFEREFVAGQEAVGIRVGGRFREVDDPDRFVWLRAFPDMEARRRALEAFYYGPVWREHREVANGTMLDSDDVLLLRGPGYRPPVGAGVVTVTICHVEPGVTGFQPGVTGFPPGAAAHRTEHAANTFPALPVREDVEVVVWFEEGEGGPLPEGVGRVERLTLEPVV
ncbi:nipsnap superfamily protein [Kitasatospora sp. MMS16-BH015]|uniref:NIPSNAP family protein n=1 Tax=Kitasatospora sp. MMS16-BH015 TaxID=2018025 RepID=UPI000CA252E9|nr:NIPSNAP family protein [Kitasatospora sp. MMS16-BH015]AUG79714.1 nipsnap superfamily protein [Kitasatospora sp. MMS16-BH015]